MRRVYPGRLQTMLTMRTNRDKHDFPLEKVKNATNIGLLLLNAIQPSRAAKE